MVWIGHSWILFLVVLKYHLIWWIKRSYEIEFLDIANTFTCDDGKVLDASKQCDDYPDCLYGEDEQDCQYDEDPTDLEYDESVVEENNGNWTIASYLKLWDDLLYNWFLFSRCLLQRFYVFESILEYDQNDQEYEPPEEEVVCDELDEFRCADGRECILKGIHNSLSKFN